ncbi:MAG: hypothetical protein R2728_06195 [Chitinophagales bacterium]
MKRFLTFFFALAILCSCEKSTDFIEGGNLTGDALLTALNGSKWRLVDCPDQNLVNINGYAECNYFSVLEFKNKQVLIEHIGNLVATPHHICSSEGVTQFPLSVQACTNTTWSPFFYWDILSYTGTTLKINLQNISFYNDYKGEFTFEKY